MKNLMELVKPNARVYIYLDSAETKQKFVSNADKEGFTYEDGARVSEREPDDIMAINEDHTINFVGTAGHIAFGAGAPVGGKELVRVDYNKFLSGDEVFEC